MMMNSETRKVDNPKYLGRITMGVYTLAVLKMISKMEKESKSLLTAVFTRDIGIKG
jgi:hypothetical protein